MHRLLTLAAIAGVALATLEGGAANALDTSPPPGVTGVQDSTTPYAGMRLPPDQTSYGGAFTLTDHHGNVVTEKSLLGRHALIYFGYTNCADICPTAMHNITVALRRLGPAGDRIQPVFVNLDTSNDSLEALAAYVGFFHPRFLGLTGSEEAVGEAARAYRVYFFSDGTGEQRFMQHSGFTFLNGPDGKVITYFGHGMPGDEMADAITYLLNLDGASPGPVR